MTGRIAWSEYPGDIENLVAMFIIRDFPFTAEHITPSRGDGGIDVLVNDGKVRVYQVKGFSKNLTSGQKGQVEESVDRLVTDPRVKDMRVDEYHLVMPWDPTLEQKAWLTDYVTSKGLPEPVWHGKSHLNAWAAKYPEVVDYYLNGQRETILEAAHGLLSGLRVRELENSTPDDVTPTQMATSLNEVVQFLNKRDPLYSYGIAVSPRLGSHPPPLDDTMSMDEAVQSVHDGVVYLQIILAATTLIRIDVYATTRLSTELRPLTVETTFKVEAGSEEEQGLLDFRKFGSPLDLPAGSMDAIVDAPGGLGLPVKDAAVRFMPQNPPSEDDERRLIVYDANGKEIVTLDMQRQYFTYGHLTDGVPLGVESRFHDRESQILAIVFRHDNETRQSSITVTVDLPSGKAAVQVVDPLQAYCELAGPNSFVLAPRYGPIPSDPATLPPRQEDASRQRLWYDLARSLVLIQDHTSRRLHFPERLDELTAEELQKITTTGALLNGQVVTSKVDEATTFHSEQPPDGPQRFAVQVPWFVELPEGRVDVGQVLQFFSGSISERAIQTEEGLVDLWQVTDSVFNMRMVEPGQLEDWTEVTRQG